MSRPTMTHCWTPGEDRSHSVYRYTDQIYKVVQWYTLRERFGPGPKEQQNHYDKKLESSISRTKRLILEKALCNPWEWFCTFTISESKYDRRDLITWRDSFTQWIRDQRKKGFDIKYVLVPERHKDGSWHAHGLFSGLPESELVSFEQMHKAGIKLPRKLWKSNYMNWPAYQEKFGFCSFGRIKNHVAAGFYITKYLTKDNDRMVQDVGLHSYYASRGLNKAEKHLDFFGRSPEIDALLVNKYDFCATGMTSVKDGYGWDFCSEYVNFDDLEALPIFGSSDVNEKSAPELEADAYFDFEQMVFL